MDRAAMRASMTRFAREAMPHCRWHPDGSRPGLADNHTVTRRRKP